MAAPSEDLALALELADVADAITLERFRAADLAVETKPDLTPVSEADTAVERTLRERLAAVRLGDAIVGEEFGSSSEAPGGRRWIVDPIDGTKNYVRGIPVWATLLALQEHDRVMLGVVSAPALGRRWWAARGAGAFASDGLSREPRPLRVSAVRALEDAQLCVSGFDGWDDTPSGLDRLLTLARRCWRTRGFGDFWIYMLVAEGVAEIGCEPAVSLWDLAAPQVIVEEAGGRFTDLGGVRTVDGGDALATNGLLHEEALALVGR
ncbi:MAG: histidinol phosphatase [Solirubrobacterales bacterium]|nr:histidinol phosphatase [Solirubrobacterales bacterium]MBV9941629.1 histidinol phosphatase [Solirubrobacterales bacterium]